MKRQKFYWHNVSRIMSVAVLAALSASTAAAPRSLCVRLAAEFHDSPVLKSEPVNRLIPNVAFAGVGTSGFGSGHCNILRIVLRNLGVPKAKSGPKAAGCSWPTDVPGLPFLERLPGTRVYMGGALAGSGDCLNAVFVETSRGPSGHPVVRRIASPQGYTSPCIGIMGGLGKVVGVPSYVESGSVRGSSFDYFIRVTPWRGHNWGPACKLTFHWRYRYRSKLQYCARQAPCRAAKAVSTELARRFVAYDHAASPREVVLRDGRAVPDLDQSARGARGLAAVARAWKMLTRQCAADAGLPVMCARYPSRKGGERLYSTFKYFPLKLGGRLYIGGIGHLGAGRAYPPILLSIYALPTTGQKMLSGLVGIWIDPRPTGAPREVITYGEEAAVTYPWE
jgi:hypothetical protein